MAPIAGSLVARIGERPLVAGGPLLQAVGMGGIGLLTGASTAYAQLVAPMFVAGAGVLMAMPAVQCTVLSAVAADPDLVRQMSLIDRFR